MREAHFSLEDVTTEKVSVPAMLGMGRSVRKSTHLCQDRPWGVVVDGNACLQHPLEVAELVCEGQLSAEPICWLVKLDEPELLLPDTGIQVSQESSKAVRMGVKCPYSKQERTRDKVGLWATGFSRPGLAGQHSLPLLRILTHQPFVCFSNGFQIPR